MFEVLPPPYIIKTIPNPDMANTKFVPHPVENEVVFIFIQSINSYSVLVVVGVGDPVPVSGTIYP